MDTKLKRSTSFHPQIDRQTKVVNRTVVYDLWIYNSSNPKTWDESLPYIQYSYNRVVDHSIEVSPFNVYMGFLPKSPIDLQLTTLSSFDSTSTSEHHGYKQAKHFIEHIQWLHKKVHEALERAHQKYKEASNKH